MQQSQQANQERSPVYYKLMHRNLRGRSQPHQALTEPRILLYLRPRTQALDKMTQADAWRLPYLRQSIDSTFLFPSITLQDCCKLRSAPEKLLHRRHGLCESRGSNACGRKVGKPPVRLRLFTTAWMRLTYGNTRPFEQTSIQCDIVNSRMRGCHSAGILCGGVVLSRFSLLRSQLSLG